MERVYLEPAKSERQAIGKTRWPTVFSAPKGSEVWRNGTSAHIATFFRPTGLARSQCGVRRSRCRYARPSTRKFCNATRAFGRYREQHALIVGANEETMQARSERWFLRDQVVGCFTLPPEFQHGGVPTGMTDRLHPPSACPLGQILQAHRLLAVRSARRARRPPSSGDTCLSPDRRWILAHANRSANRSSAGAPGSGDDRGGWNAGGGDHNPTGSTATVRYREWSTPSTPRLTVATRTDRPARRWRPSHSWGET